MGPAISRLGEARCADANHPPRPYLSKRLRAYATVYTVDPMITWDEHKRLRNLADHGIDLDELDGFFDGELLTMEDVREAYGEVRFQSVGLFQGVPLFVAWAPRGGDDVPHVISARKAVKHEEQAWHWRYSKRL